MSRQEGLAALMTDRCRIFVRYPVEPGAEALGAPEDGGSGLMRYQEVALSPEPVPCRVSFSSAPAAGEGSAAAIGQTVKLFLPPGIEVPAGSKIAVTREGKTAFYTRSGEPARYPTHQEITLELWERWA